MIYIQQAITGSSVFTLTEKTTLSSPYFLFEFISDDSRISKIFTAPDISSNTARYNEFDIILTGGTENLLDGLIKLNINGFYKYNCYEMSGSTNLDISGTTGVILEKGKVLISGTTEPVKISYESQPRSRNVYVR